MNHFFGVNSTMFTQHWPRACETSMLPSFENWMILLLHWLPYISLEAKSPFSKNFGLDHCKTNISCNIEIWVKYLPQWLTCTSLQSNTPLWQNIGLAPGGFMRQEARREANRHLHVKNNFKGGTMKAKVWSQKPQGWRVELPMHLERVCFLWRQWVTLLPRCSWTVVMPQASERVKHILWEFWRALLLPHFSGGGGVSVCPRNGRDPRCYPGVWRGWNKEKGSILDVPMVTFWESQVTV